MPKTWYFFILACLPGRSVNAQSYLIGCMRGT
jgi:hypothetical protein